MGSQVPAFAAEGRAGLLDFWTVYARVIAALQGADDVCGLPDAVARSPEGAALVAEVNAVRGLLGRAIVDDEWPPFIAHARELGTRYARLGVSFDDWYEVVRVFHRRVMPALVEAYADSPARLTAALRATTQVLDFWIAHIAEPYVEGRQRDRLRLLVDGVKDHAIYMIDPAGVVTSWNAGAQALFGYAAEDVLGQPFAVFFPQAAREAGRPGHALAVAAQAGRFQDEGPRVRKDGALFWAEATVTAIRAAEHLVGFANVVRDLTERRQAEAERLGLEERFRALAKATSDAIVIADHHGTITYANHASATLFGAPASALIGQPLTVLMPERMRDAHRAGLARFLASHEPRMMGRVLEQPALRHDGSERVTEMTITTWTAGGELSFAAIIRDVSERKAIAAMLEERTHQLEATNREIEAFSYSVAHDLRAPLRGVSGFTQILLEDFAPRLDREAVNYLTKIQGGVARMTALIDALLELARLSRGELVVKPVNLTALARAILAQLAASDPARTVEVQIDAGLRAMADGRLVRTLLENLIGNAWKFTGKRASARIEIGSSDNRTFYVRDNGAGFDMAQASKLFAPFERLHTADEFPGTGVGLATVQRIVDRHGGRIWVQASPGAGATFFFTLSPADRASASDLGRAP